MKKSCMYVRGIGNALPQRKVTNEAFSLMTGVSVSQIEERCTIKTRFLSSSPDAARRLATIAARQALWDGRALADNVRVLVVATSCAGGGPPVFTARKLRRELDLRYAQTIDITTRGVGFFQAVAMCEALLPIEAEELALVVAAEAFSAVGSQRDHRDCYAYSEGAGALLLSRKEGFARVQRLDMDAIALPRREGNPPDLSPEKLPINTIADLPTVHLSQHVRKGEEKLDGNSQSEQIDLFPETGWFLSASPPLHLFAFLTERQPQPPLRIVLSDNDSEENQGLIEFELLRSHHPRLVEDAALEGATPAIAERLTVCSTAEEMKGHLQLCPNKKGEGWNAIVVLGLRSHIAEDQPARLVELATDEATQIIEHHTRHYDRVLRLGNRPRFAVLLQFIAEPDAQRLGDRLATLLVDVDPAGELEVTCDTRCIALSADETRSSLIESLVTFLDE